MSRDRRLWLAGRLPRFQFSIANLLALTAAVAFCLGIGRVSVPLGALVAILLFGSWTTSLAVAHCCHKTAYLLAAWTAGTVWYLGASAPISALGVYFAFGEPWPNLLYILLACAASLLTAVSVRLLPSSDGIEFTVSALVLPSGLMALFFTSCLNVTAWLSLGRIKPLGLSIELLLSLAVLVGLSLHVTGPLGMLILEVLRDVEKMAMDVARAEEEILDAVATLHILEKRPVTADDVARHTLCDPRTTARLLQRHLRAGRVTWGEDEGYSLPPGLTSSDLPADGESR